MAKGVLPARRFEINGLADGRSVSNDSACTYPGSDYIYGYIQS
jgi:hypothetical protein